MGVAAQVFEDLLGSSEGRLGVDDPLLIAQRRQIAGKSGGIPERLDFAGKGKLGLLEHLLEVVEKQAAEQAREHLHGNQESRAAATDPALLIGGESAARDDAMQMGMVQEILPPGVQDGEEADLGAEVAGIGGNGEQCLRDHPEEHGVDQLLGVESDPGHLGGQGEHDVEVGDRQQFGLPLFEPAGPFRVLALGAMPVTAGVVGNPAVSAAAAFLDMAAERRRAAGFNGPHDSQVLEREPVRGPVSGAVLPEDAGQFEARPRHAYFLDLAGVLGRRWSSWSRGLRVAPTSLGDTAV